MEINADLAELLFRRVEDPILVLGSDGRPHFHSRAFAEMLGFDGAIANGETIDFAKMLRWVHELDRGSVRAALARPSDCQVRIQVRRPNEDWEILELQIEGHDVGRVLRLRPISLAATGSSDESVEPVK